MSQVVQIEEQSFYTNMSFTVHIRTPEFSQVGEMFEWCFERWGPAASDAYVYDTAIGTDGHGRWHASSVLQYRLWRFEEYELAFEFMIRWG